MKKLLKKTAVLALTVTLGIFLFSCENGETMDSTNSNDYETSNYSDNSMTTFSSPDDYDLKIKNYFGRAFEIGEVVGEDAGLRGQKLIVAGQMVGVIVSDDEGKMGFTDSRTEGRVKYFDLRKNRLFDMPIVFNPEYQILVPDFNGGYFTEVKDNRCQGQFTLCSAGCTLAAVAVAASDGPLPFMDALAITGWTTCQGLCLSSYDLCVNPPKN